MSRDDQEEKSAARDFVLARLAVCRGVLANAAGALDECIAHFIDPTDDAKGKDRRQLMETIDASIGEAARAIQAAGEAFKDVDTREGEPDEEEDEEEDDEPGDEDDDAGDR